jgi:hypothetical protein
MSAGEEYNKLRVFEIWLLGRLYKGEATAGWGKNIEKMSSIIRTSPGTRIVELMRMT